MTLKDALKRIEELERKVKELEARPTQHIHHHYHQPQPQYWGQPLYPYPMYPTLGQPWRSGGSSLQGVTGTTVVHVPSAWIIPDETTTTAS